MSNINIIQMSPYDTQSLKDIIVFNFKPSHSNKEESKLLLDITKHSNNEVINHENALGREYHYER
jgi:hypothetical protein